VDADPLPGPHVKGRPEIRTGDRVDHPRGTRLEHAVVAQYLGRRARQQRNRPGAGLEAHHGVRDRRDGGVGHNRAPREEQRSDGRRRDDWCHENLRMSVAGDATKMNRKLYRSAARRVNVA
jgi:hypothetical protein